MLIKEKRRPQPSSSLKLEKRLFLFLQEVLPAMPVANSKKWWVSSQKLMVVLSNEGALFHHISSFFHCHLKMLLSHIFCGKSWMDQWVSWPGEPIDGQSFLPFAKDPADPLPWHWKSHKAPLQQNRHLIHPMGTRKWSHLGRLLILQLNCSMMFNVS